VIFHRLSRRYGWTPGDVGRLTLGQLTAYLTDPTETVLIDRHEIRTRLARRQQQRDRWIDAVLRARHGTI
jgi:hypothetical protein